DGRATPPGVGVSLVPVRPLWIGVGVNTALFTVLASLGFSFVRGLLVARQLRSRQQRQDAGLCVYCGYPIVLGEKCPECGREGPVSNAPAEGGSGNGSSLP